MMFTASHGWPQQFPESKKHVPDLVVSSKVLAQNAGHDQTNDTEVASAPCKHTRGRRDFSPGEEDEDHERVDNGEPVNVIVGHLSTGHHHLHIYTSSTPEGKRPSGKPT
eukprot:760319-Hanusia_phi.AAC.3